MRVVSNSYDQLVLSHSLRDTKGLLLAGLSFLGVLVVPSLMAGAAIDWQPVQWGAGALLVAALIFGQPIRVTFQRSIQQIEIKRSFFWHKVTNTYPLEYFQKAEKDFSNSSSGGRASRIVLRLKDPNFTPEALPFEAAPEDDSAPSSEIQVRLGVNQEQKLSELRKLLTNPKIASLIEDGIAQAGIQRIPLTKSYSGGIGASKTKLIDAINHWWGQGY